MLRRILVFLLDRLLPNWEGGQAFSLDDDDEIVITPEMKARMARMPPDYPPLPPQEPKA